MKERKRAGKKSCARGTQVALAVRHSDVLAGMYKSPLLLRKYVLKACVIVIAVAVNSNFEKKFRIIWPMFSASFMKCSLL